jgi:hypothetical protein
MWSLLNFKLGIFLEKALYTFPLVITMSLAWKSEVGGHSCKQAPD